MSRHIPAFVVCLTLVSKTLVTAEDLGMIAVDAGEHRRVDTLVSVELPGSVKASRPLRLEEIRDAARVPVPAQVERGQASSRLWFVLGGETAPGSTRRYALRYGVPVTSGMVTMELGSRTLDVVVGGSRLFSYNHAHVVPPAGVKPEYIRSGYIYPMFSVGGKLITEDFPADHYHHKGIWFPWTKTDFDGKSIDFWNLGKNEGTVQHAGFDLIENGPVFGRFVARHEFVDLTQAEGGKVALDETWEVRVFAVGGPRGGGYRLWDLTSRQRCASSSPLHLKQYRYGGLAFRGAREWKGENYTLLTSEGKTKENGHTTRAKWCAHSGAVDGQPSTVVLMCSPRNKRFPEPMRIWAKGGAFFNYTPIQAGDWTLEPGKTYVFSYRFLVHEGGIDAKRAERMWNDFGSPPVARIE